MDHPKKSGWLIKEGANWKTWRKRWFVLEKGEIKYYKSQNTKKELGSFLLENATYIKPTNARKKMNCFEIPTPDRVYFMCANNAQEMKEWVESCRTAKEIMAKKNKQNNVSEYYERETTGIVSNEKRIGIEDFELMKVIGKGSFGKVLLAKKIDTGKIYAMKVLDKKTIKEKDDIEHAKSERNILKQLDCPFLVKLYYTFQTTDKLYYIMDFINGGELFYHLQQERIFDEKRVQFYCAEILLGLEYLHNKGIIYRDLKPENILIRRDGHICMTDFGISKEGLTATNDRTATFCGTPEYLAPEVLEGKKYGKAVDYWSYGTFMYEMLTGLPPFYSQDLQVMYQKILGAKLIIPDTMNTDAADLLCQLLERDPEKRLQDPNKMKNHPYFTNIDWDKLYKMELTPPFRPKVSGEESTEMIDPSFVDENPVSDEESEEKVENTIINSGNQNNEFEGFTFVAQSNHLN